MKLSLILGIALFVCGSAIAEGIYKWTDENGKVHYGDRNDTKKNSTQIIVRTPARVPDKEGVSGTDVNGNGSNSTTTDEGNLQRCLVMARTMVNKKDSTPSEVRADSKQLLDMCPATAYNCVTYTKSPEKNNCTAVTMQPNGSITRNTTYNR